MRTNSDPRLVQWLHYFAASAAVFTVANGLAGLAGWAFRIESLYTWGAAPVTMKPNTCACFILIGASLWLLRTKITRPLARTGELVARVTAVATSLLALLALWEHIFTRNFAIDELLFRAPSAIETASIHPSLMSPVTAAAFLLLGLALLGIDWRTRRGHWPAQILSLTAGAGAIFGVLSFAFDPRVYAANLSLALPTAVTIVLFSLGLVCSRTDRGLGSLLCSRGLDGSLARRLLPAAFVPVVVGWIRWRITATGIYSEWSVVVLASLLTMSLLIAIIAWAAVAVDRNEVERRKVEEALNVTEEQLNRLLDRLDEPLAEASLRRNVIGGFVAAALLTSSLGFLSWHTSLRAEEDADTVIHAQIVLRTLDTAVRHLVDVETGGRGFAMSGYLPFLESFESGRKLLGTDMETLHFLIKDSPGQQRRLDLLMPQIKDKIEASDRLVAARQRTRTAPTASQLDRGQQLTDAACSTIQQLEDEEESLLLTSTERTRKARRLTLSTMVLGSMLALALVIAAGFPISRQIGMSARARAQVVALNSSLEQRVERRTAALQSEIAERTLAEHALKNSLAVSEQVLKDLADQKFALDQHAIVAVTDVQGTITYVNEKFCAISRYAEDELLGRNHRILNSGHHPREFFQQMYHSIANGKVWQGEIKNRAKDGSIYWVDTTIVPFMSAEGKPQQYVAIRTDVTQRKASEREIQKLNAELESRVVERTAQLEDANKELEAFSYSVSHDLRAPLRHISGFSRMLVEEFSSALSPVAQNYLERIQSGTQKMGLLVDELLNLARVGRHSLNLQRTSLDAIIADVIAILGPESEGRKVQWQIADMPAVECDPVLVKQIFQNLLANALKFTRTRELALIEIGTENADDGQLVFVVRDNGIGFNMKYVDKLFGVFQRLHRAEDFEGTGIGLATVQRIVKKHRGRAWAEGELDKGAAFYFTLSATNREPEKSKEASAGGQL